MNKANDCLSRTTISNQGPNKEKCFLQHRLNNMEFTLLSKIEDGIRITCIYLTFVVSRRNPY